MNKNSLLIFKNVIVKKRGELFASIQIVIIITIILSILMYFAESAKFSSPIDTFMWSISKFVGDIPQFSEQTPETIIGKWIAFCIGILSLAFIAIPTGIFASSFTEELSLNQRKIYLKEIHEALITAFDYESDIALEALKSKLKINFTKRRGLSLKNAIYTLNFSENDLIEAIHMYGSFRFKTRKATKESKTADNVLIEYFLMNRLYGGFIQNNSKLTIINQKGKEQAFSSHFLSVVNCVSNSNFISNERFYHLSMIKEDRFNLTVNEDLYDNGKLDSTSLDTTSEKSLMQWINDIENLAKFTETFVLFSYGASSREAKLDIVIGGNKGDSIENTKEPTINNIPKFKQFFDELVEESKLLEYEVVLQKDFDKSSTYSLANYIRTKYKKEVIVIYLNVEILDWVKMGPYYKFAVLIGEKLNKYYGN